MSYEDDLELDTDVEDPVEFAKKTGMARIQELIATAQSAIREAEKIAKEEDLPFNMQLGAVNQKYNPTYGYEVDDPDYWEPSMIC